MRLKAGIGQQGMADVNFQKDQIVWGRIQNQGCGHSVRDALTQLFWLQGVVP